jgi:hypothetical protein
MIPIVTTIETASKEAMIPPEVILRFVGPSIA